MKVKYLGTVGSWRAVADAARTTIGMDPGEGEPSLEWKRRMLLAEHSPIRQLSFRVKLMDLPYWVSVHLVRHKIGIEHWVSSQREDYSGVARHELRQDELVTHEMLINAQAMINISRKRMCNKAAPETQKAWKMVVFCIGQHHGEFTEVCVPECTYRGFCPEFTTCGMFTALPADEWLQDYRCGSKKTDAHEDPADTKPHPDDVVGR